MERYVEREQQEALLCPTHALQMIKTVPPLSISLSSPPTSYSRRPVWGGDLGYVFGLHCCPVLLFSLFTLLAELQLFFCSIAG